MSEISASLQQAKKRAGGNSGLGRLLGISPQAVSQWRQVPADRVLEIERATGLSRHELRPDIFDAQPGGHGADEATSRPVGDQDGGHFSRFFHLRGSHFTSSEEIVEHVRSLRDEWDRR